MKHGIMPVGFVSAQLQAQRMLSPVRAVVIDSLAEGVSLRSLGAWRFRGLPEAVDLVQLDAADLLADVPPPRSATLPSSEPVGGQGRNARNGQAAGASGAGRTAIAPERE
jgi:hypothetical protein